MLITDGPFIGLPQHAFGALLADPPWHFKPWASDATTQLTHPAKHYATMKTEEIYRLPVQSLAAPDCVLFLWITWPMLLEALQTVGSWGFSYRTCAFAWIKADGTQLDMFMEDIEPQIGCGFWTRANSEVCLLATRGTPKRLDRGVRQAIIEPRRQHSRKPDCVHERIERLVSGPYLELFARQSRANWVTWGEQRTKFDVPTAAE